MYHYLRLIFNLYPLIGAVYFHWDIFTFFLFYWLESIIIYIIDLFKLRSNRQSFRSLEQYYRWLASAVLFIVVLLPVEFLILKVIGEKLHFSLTKEIVLNLLIWLLFTVLINFTVRTYTSLVEQRINLGKLKKSLKISAERIVALHISITIGYGLYLQFNYIILIMVAFVLIKIWYDLSGESNLIKKTT